MAKVIAISNQKGGVGKSTTAGALGAGLQQRGFSVLWVDMDGQGNLSYSMRANGAAITTLEVLTGTAAAKDAIINKGCGDIIPAGPATATAELYLQDTGKEYKLREALEPVKENYDYIVIDCPPALGILTTNALTAADCVVIPAQADVFSLQGVGQLCSTINAVKKYCNHSLTISGLLLNRYNARTVLSKDMTDLLQDMAKQLNVRVYESRIRECNALREAQASKQSIFDYAPKSNGAKDYEAFIAEMLEE